MIIKQVENKKLGITIASPCKNIEEQVVSISYVDDTDLMTDGEDDIEKMQESINEYDNYYGATGGKIETDKSTYFAWQ